MWISNKDFFELEQKIEKLRYDFENPPKYYQGQILTDGTIVCNVQKTFMPPSTTNLGDCFAPYFWSYTGMKDGQIINIK